MGLWAAAAQLCSNDNVADNLTRARTVVKAAADAGARLVGLPENFAYLGSDRDHKVAIAEEIHDEARGPILETMRETARQTGVWLLLGGFPEKVVEPGNSGAAAGEKIGNTSVLL